ncbi:UNVERIFIED_CONTAM: 50S ribosomal protein L20 [Sesamum calycinum]|uniref:Large ribosomal subunit protein bL20c n=1 Tax=Sesamum calycinum TaxID=2727403 RepID=A0AAW2KTC1_9LAMI
MNKKEVLKLAKGFRGRAKNCIRIAREREWRRRSSTPTETAATRSAICVPFGSSESTPELANTECVSCSIIGFLPCFVLKSYDCCLRLFWNGRLNVKMDGFREKSVLLWSRKEDGSGKLRFSVVNYGNFMHGLMKENIQLNRKVLSELSMHEPYSFKALVDISRDAFPGNKTVVPPKKEGLAILV